MILHCQELDRLEEGAKVFKMMGPVLVKQDIEEARQTVQKRIDYIGGEMYAYQPKIINAYC